MHEMILSDSTSFGDIPKSQVCRKRSKGCALEPESGDVRYMDLTWAHYETVESKLPVAVNLSIIKRKAYPETRATVETIQKLQPRSRILYFSNGRP